MQKGAEYIHSPAKRRLDVVGGLAIAAATLPVTAAIVIETMAEHRTLNPFFVHRRVGKSGGEFDVYKFITLHDHEEVDMYLGGFNHPHASRLGRFIRATGTDELPQIANVLRGDMSLVGIRPMPADHMERYREMVDDEELFTEWRECYEQNPGLTGQGQLYTKRFPEHDNPDILRQRMKIDIEGFHNASLGADLRILGRTPLEMLKISLGVRPPTIPATDRIQSYV